jgi:hypothetical protein
MLRVLATEATTQETVVTDTSATSKIVGFRDRKTRWSRTLNLDGLVSQEAAATPDRRHK